MPGQKWIEFDRNLPSGHIKGKFAEHRSIRISESYSIYSSKPNAVCWRSHVSLYKPPQVTYGQLADQI
jgi:hypothetical protein